MSRFDNNMNIFDLVRKVQETRKLNCILVDEAQFMTKKQVTELCNVIDDLNIPCIAYGLRTDFKGNLFPGSEALLSFADSI